MPVDALIMRLAKAVEGEDPQTVVVVVALFVAELLERYHVPLDQFVRVVEDHGPKSGGESN